MKPSFKEDLLKELPYSLEEQKLHEPGCISREATTHVHSNMSMEIQPVIMAAGKGSRMQDLTTHTPKALLPIANKPMVWYPVNMLQKAGFNEAIVIVTKSHLEDIRKSLVEINQVKMRLKFEAIPDSDDWGTADSLRSIASKIKSDMLIVSGDLITDVPVHKLVDLHRAKNSTVTMLLASMPDTKAIQVPGVKGNSKVLETDFIGLEKDGNKDQERTRLAYLMAEADLDGFLEFSPSYLKKHPNVMIHADLLDAHMYIMKRTVLDFLKAEKDVSTIKGELMPKLVRRQFKKTKSTEKEEEVNFDKLYDSDITEEEQIELLSKLTEEMSTYPQEKTPSRIKCRAYTQNGGFCVRTNTVMMYCEANRNISRDLIIEDGDVSKFQSVHPTVKLNKSTVGADSMVGEGSSIGEKVVIKKSTIGRHCIIKDKVKITNSIIMDYTVIEEGCNITGSVICSQVEIGEKSEVKDSIVTAHQKINPMGTYTNEAVTEPTRMMAIE